MPVFNHVFIHDLHKSLKPVSLPETFVDHAEEIWGMLADGMTQQVVAPVDLFDKLDSVAVQKVEKLTHAVIAENMGFHVDSVKDLSKLISNVGANVLNFAKAYQDGRAPKKEAIAPFNFTEGWFRNSGIYTLPTHHNPRLEMCLNLQADFLHWFCIENKCSAKKKDIDNQGGRFESRETLDAR